MIRRIATVAMVLMMTACARPADTVDAPPPPDNTALADAGATRPNAPDPLDDDCTARGGTLVRAGKGGQMFCEIRYGDAGKACSDKADCEGRCIAPDTDPVGSGNAAKRTNAIGQCQATNMQFGCRAEIRNGVRQATLCID